MKINSFTQGGTNVTNAVAISPSCPIVMSRAQRAMLVRLQKEKRRHDEVTRVAFEAYVAEHGEHFDYWECLNRIVAAIRESDRMYEMEQEPECPAAGAARRKSA